MAYTTRIVLVERGDVEGREGIMLPCGNEGAAAEPPAADLRLDDETTDDGMCMIRIGIRICPSNDS